MRSSRCRRRFSSADAGNDSRDRLTWTGIPFSRPSGLVALGHLPHQRGQVDGVDVDVAAARLDGREIQDVIDQPQHRLTAAADHLHVLPLLHRQRSGVPLDEQLAERDQRAERAAEIVAHPQEEEIVRPVGAVAALRAAAVVRRRRGRVGARARTVEVRAKRPRA